MKGYKVFNNNLQCRGFQFAIGYEFKYNSEFEVCKSGFHFCEKITSCFNYYDFNPDNRVCEIEAIGEVKKKDDKSSTNHIKIIRELTWNEVLFLSNEGINNNGYCNSGGSNNGNKNTGNRNNGHRNSGDSNNGNYNSGDSNNGNYNTGNKNSGDSNTGDSNTGHRNSGRGNNGRYNSGNFNTGDRNSGYSNIGDNNAGVFCTGMETVLFFNKPSNWTYKCLFGSMAFKLLIGLKTNQFIDKSLMSDEEKEKNPSYTVTGGYLKEISYKEAFSAAWKNWNEEERAAFTSLPNFDTEIFYLITGVKV